MLATINKGQSLHSKAAKSTHKKNLYYRDQSESTVTCKKKNELSILLFLLFRSIDSFRNKTPNEQYNYELCFHLLMKQSIRCEPIYCA